MEMELRAEVPKRTLFLMAQFSGLEPESKQSWNTRPPVYQNWYCEEKKKKMLTLLSSENVTSFKIIRENFLETGYIKQNLLKCW